MRTCGTYEEAARKLGVRWTTVKTHAKRNGITPGQPQRNTTARQPLVTFQQMRDALQVSSTYTEAAKALRMSVRNLRDHATRLGYKPGKPRQNHNHGISENPGP